MLEACVPQIRNVFPQGRKRRIQPRRTCDRERSVRGAEFPVVDFRKARTAMMRQKKRQRGRGRVLHGLKPEVLSRILCLACALRERLRVKRRDSQVTNILPQSLKGRRYAMLQAVATRGSIRQTIGRGAGRRLRRSMSLGDTRGGKF